MNNLKQRAKAWLDKLDDLGGSTCAIEQEAYTLLQELIDAPEAEPVARVTGYYAGYLSIETIDGRVLPAGTAVYTSPPAPSAPDGWRPFLTDVITAAGLLEHGKRDKGLAGRIGKFAFAAMRAAPTPAEPPADVVRDAERWQMLPAFLAEFQVPYLQLVDKIDAAIEREILGGDA